VNRMLLECTATPNWGMCRMKDRHYLIFRKCRLIWGVRLRIRDMNALSMSIVYVGILHFFSFDPAPQMRTNKILPSTQQQLSSFASFRPRDDKKIWDDGHNRYLSCLSYDMHIRFSQLSRTQKVEWRIRVVLTKK
jgi:hypothetical protein